MLEIFYFFELSLNILVLLLLFLIIFFPIGKIITKGFSLKLGDEFKFLLALAFGFLFYALLIGLCIKIGLNNKTLSWIIRIISISSSALYLQKNPKFYKCLSSPKNKYIAILYYLFLVLCISITALPNNNWRNINHEQTRMVFNLPVDNFLPYQGARFIFDRLNPKDIEVAGGWKFSDRGPLASFATATVFLFANINENHHWSDASVGLAFIYQTLVVALNLLSLVLIYFICIESFGLATAVIACLFFCSNYFFIINTAFTWPKLFMIFYFFFGIYLIKKEVSLFIVGTMVGGALLSHNSAVFSLPMFGLCLIYYSAKKYNLNLFKPKEIFLATFKIYPFILGYLCTIGPWSYFKKLYAPDSKKLLFMHLLCDQSDKIPTGSFKDAFIARLTNTPIEQLLHVVWTNLIHPVDIPYSWGTISLLASNPLYAINGLSSYTFFQLYLAVGVIAFIAFLTALIFAKRDQKILYWIYAVLISFSSYPVASLIFACERGTLNHHCGYPSFIISIILAAYLLSKNNFFSKTLATLQVGLSLMFAAIYIYFHSELKIFIHASNYYFIFHGIIVFAILLLPAIILKNPLEENTKYE